MRKKLSEMDIEYLKYKIRSKKIKQSEFPGMVGISRSSFYKKMRGDIEWTCEEMKKINKALGLSLEEFNKIFGF